MKIQGAVAFVTGANRGLGLAFAEELLNRGASKVYAGVRNPDTLDLPGVVPVAVDVNDADSVRAAAERCGDVTLLVNNAGIVAVTPQGALDPTYADVSRAVFETNYYGTVRTSQAFVPVISGSGGGAIINVLSDATWFAPPFVAAYAASKSAVWGYTNALRTDVRDQAIQVLGLHVGMLDTDMTRGIDARKSDPRDVVAVTLDGLENGDEEVLADHKAQEVKSTLSSARPFYFDPVFAD
jgi:NAD(P)-dependent dehydrogenase (short-subunit alcohol dehydrogenase family)